MNTKIFTHKGRDVYFDADTERFYAIIDGETIYGISLKEMKKKIDGMMKKFDRFEIIRFGSGGWRNDDARINVCTVTSIAPNKDVWITTKGGSREKFDRYGNKVCILNTPENMKIAEEIVDIRKMIADANKAIEKLEGKFKCFDVAAYVKKTFEATEGIRL